MAKRLTFQELQPQPVGRELRADLVTTGESLKAVLHPRRPVLALDGDSVTFQNLVGSALLPGGDIVEVAPKVEGEGDWTRAVVQLLDPDTRIAVTGSQRSQPSVRQNDLSSALALEYARRLESALRTEGPLNVYERRSLNSRRLNGHLDVTRYVRTALSDPAKFPISRDELTSANDFSRGFSLVAGWLARAVYGGDLALRLRRLQAAVIPGQPIPSYVNAAIARRQIPSQWGRYKPAWDIAAPLLRHLSVVGDPGRAAGLEVAVEPWPLLETALTRALRALARRGDADGFEFVPKGTYRLLTRNNTAAVSVIPDGLLLRKQGEARPARHRFDGVPVPSAENPLGGSVAATFECKYTVPSDTPDRDHVYQALTTAAALRSPLSVLVYPGSQAPRRYTTEGFHGTPAELVTVGLSLFSYRRGVSDSANAELIAWLLAQWPGVDCGWRALRTGSNRSRDDLP